MKVFTLINRQGARHTVSWRTKTVFRNHLTGKKEIFLGVGYLETCEVRTALGDGPYTDEDGHRVVLEN